MVNEIRTFTKRPNTLTIDGRAMIVDVGHKELAEMFDDGPPDSVSCNPLHDRLGLDIAQLFNRDLLYSG